ncbi:DNA repair protein RadA, partial [Staphylococcus warneri]
GGVVPGSAILLGGDPGVGKSTLLLEVTAKAARNGAKVAYISGEEAIEQIRARAKRMGVADADVSLASATALRDILTTLKRDPFDIV